MLLLTDERKFQNFLARLKIFFYFLGSAGSTKQDWISMCRPVSIVAHFEGAAKIELILSRSPSKSGQSFAKLPTKVENSDLYKFWRVDWMPKCRSFRTWVVPKSQSTERVDCLSVGTSDATRNNASLLDRARATSFLGVKERKFHELQYRSPHYFLIYHQVYRKKQGDLGFPTYISMGKTVSTSHILIYNWEKLSNNQSLDRAIVYHSKSNGSRQCSSDRSDSRINGC